MKKLKDIKAKSELSKVTFVNGKHEVTLDNELKAGDTISLPNPIIHERNGTVLQSVEFPIAEKN